MSAESPDTATSKKIERSGRIAEADLFGTVDIHDPAYREAAEQWVSKSELLVQKLNARTLSEREQNALLGSAYRLIENLPEYRNHPERRVNPDRPALRDLRLALAEGLEFQSDEDVDRIEAYSAIGSIVDHALSLDGFFKVRGKTSADLPICISFDYTINKDKNRTRADVLIKQLPDPDLEEDAYVRAIDNAGLAMTREYRRKIELRERRFQRR